MNASVGYSNLSRDEVNSLTDLYIAAKENGLDASQVGLVAFWLGGYNDYQGRGIIIGEAYDVLGMFPFTAEELAAFDAEMFTRIQGQIDLAGELKAKLSNVSFGFDDESGFFRQLLNPRIKLGSINDDTLSFLQQMADLKASGPASGESWTWSPATGWTTDPDSPEAVAARSAYEKRMEQTAEEYQRNFGDKTGKAARSSREADRAGDLDAALANIARERELLGQLLKPLIRPAPAEDDARPPLARLEAQAPIPAAERSNRARAAGR
jgi:hypothetical protein